MSDHTAQRRRKRGTRTLRVIPLGGAGEIGKNCILVECGGDMVIVDVGVMFPSDEMHGVDLVIPDFSYVLEHWINVRGIILSHGHEDHIGALPYLLKQLAQRIPIYGAPL